MRPSSIVSIFKKNSNSDEGLKKNYRTDLYATVGCHPTRSAEFDNYGKGPEGYLQALDDIIGSHLSGPGRVVAVGECGLGSSSSPI